MASGFGRHFALRADEGCLSAHVPLFTCAILLLLLSLQRLYLNFVLPFCSITVVWRQRNRTSGRICGALAGLSGGATVYSAVNKAEVSPLQYGHVVISPLWLALFLFSAKTAGRQG
jgi:hypothetical protein